MPTVDDKVFMACVAEQGGKYDDMFNFVQEVIELKNTDFTVVERNLMSVAFKNVIS